MGHGYGGGGEGPGGRPAVAPMRRSGAPTAGVITVLLADDTATVRLVLRRILDASHAFHVVGEASDGRQAVDLATSLEPDLLLLDLDMPVMNGMEAIPLIRRSAPATRIVVLSGFTAERMGAEAVEAGATAYLEKSYRPDELVARLVEVCGTMVGPQAGRDAVAPVMALAPLAREAQQRFRLAFEHAPIGMAVVSPDDHFLEVNPSLCRMAGLTEDELLVRALADLSHPEDREAAAAARRGLLGGGGASSTIETRLRRPDGRVIWALVGCSVVRDDDGRPSQLVAQVVDITEQKRAERELTRSNTDLSTFAYLAAHELKSPLQAVSGFASLLDRVHGPSLDDQGREFVAWIVDGSARMNALIEDLLTYCSVDAAEPVLAPVALDRVVGDALAQIERESAGPAAHVAGDPLPVVTADEFQFAQLFQNLLANAVKFVPPGATPQVHLSAERTPDGWTLTVADSGIGIDDAHRDRIFSMFERLHPRERYKGTGIGLAICKRIVERRGGAIWVEPNGGGGSRFRFTVPDAVPAEVQATIR
ncbi:MAG: PAS domain S-box protein [Actinomycetota bacterium]|nr:PAS domain S-box protein [Actinomycetota bacterium]